MSRIDQIYESLNREDRCPRTLPLPQLKNDLAPWYSTDSATPPKAKTGRTDANIQNALKSTVRFRMKLERTTPAKQCVKRTSYCFESEDNPAKDPFTYKRYSSDHQTDRKFLTTSCPGQRKLKIKSLNDQELLKKYLTINKLASIQSQCNEKSHYQTVMLIRSRQRNTIETRSRNIQMIRHISQKRADTIK